MQPVGASYTGYYLQNILVPTTTLYAITLLIFVKPFDSIAANGK